MLLFLFYQFLVASAINSFPWQIVQPINSDPEKNYGYQGQASINDTVWIFGGVPENRSAEMGPEFWTGFSGANGVLRNFNITSKTFQTFPSTLISPPARSFFDMVRGSGNWSNSLFLFGGQGQNPNLTDSKDLGDLWRFDTLSLQWHNLSTSLIGDIPPPRTGPAMVAATNGLIYIYGGTQNWGAITFGDLYEYHPNNNIIIKKNFTITVTPVPPSRAITNIASYLDSFYITGGCCNTTSPTGGYYQDMWKFNTTTNLWTQINQQGQVYSAAYAGSVAINDIWLFQGGDLGGCTTDLILAETSVFYFPNGTWARSFVPRYASSGPVIKNAKLSLGSDGNVYQFGGYSTNRPDNGWCTQANQIYKNLIYQYQPNNQWAELAASLSGSI